MKTCLVFFLTVCLMGVSRAQTETNENWKKLPVKALLLSAPRAEDVPMFCDFIRDALPKEGVNTLVLRIRYHYEFKSNPAVIANNPLSEAALKAIVQACRDVGIRFIPKMNLLGHQSDEEYIMPILKNYPEFDESPAFNPPSPWKPAEKTTDFYSKSLCPQHPGLLPVLFPLIDELIDVCDADAFHVGLDEVWIIGDDNCPRCGGMDKSELFADYVTKLHQHLQEKECEMWMWSDRLIDGKTTGLLGWQASMNDTHRAIDLIPKDIVICDWKYEDAAPTPAYFAVKGFDVLPSSCYNPDAALAQLDQLYAIRKNALRASFSTTISGHMKGVFHTMWRNSREFIDAYYGRGEDREGSVRTFKALFAAIRASEKEG